MMKNYIFILLLLMLVFVMPGIVQSDNGELLPQSVRIKTPTQTFNRYYYLALKNGRIFFKLNAETTGRNDHWKRFLGTGLPYNKKIKHYPIPSSIAEIHADADEIKAILRVDKNGWELYDTSGIQRNQIWVKHENKK